MLKLPASGPAQLRAGPSTIAARCRGRQRRLHTAGTYNGADELLEHLPDDLFGHLALYFVASIHEPEIRGRRPSRMRKSRRRSRRTFTHVGIGTVRTRPCLPARSTMHQRPSRCWMCANISAATSDRRNRRGDAVEDERLQPLPLRKLFRQNQFGRLGPFIGP